MSDFMQWVTHGIKRGRFEVSPRLALRLFALVVVLTVMAALYLMLVSRTAARGRHIQQLEAELFRLRRENEQLEVEIASEGSISHLWERAVELDFAPAEDVEFLRPVAGEP
jgi:cell division protein FtsL